MARGRSDAHRGRRAHARAVARALALRAGKSLGDFAVNYEINVYSDQPQAGPRLYAALHRSILDVFNEYGVQIMTPAYEGDPEQAKVVPKDKWFELPARPEGSSGDGTPSAMAATASTTRDGEVKARTPELS